ncbi:hypothetical protein [Prescottella agglutinans]|uniref:hypothetical protein n=1 Tax=Prescottella agglutinans TaxID=1644129 RepID=UPI002475FE35|nr:hypothetical protein [Prescottella agglutinans]
MDEFVVELAFRDPERVRDLLTPAETDAIILEAAERGESLNKIREILGVRWATADQEARRLGCRDRFATKPQSRKKPQQAAQEQEQESSVVDLDALMLAADTTTTVTSAAPTTPSPEPVSSAADSVRCVEESDGQLALDFTVFEDATASEAAELPEPHDPAPEPTANEDETASSPPTIGRATPASRTCMAFHSSLRRRPKRGRGPLDTRILNAARGTCTPTRRPTRHADRVPTASPSRPAGYAAMHSQSGPRQRRTPHHVSPQTGQAGDFRAPPRADASAGNDPPRRARAWMARARPFVDPWTRDGP